MTEKLDFKKRDKALYSGKPGRWDRLTIPPMTFLAIDGQGDPNGPAYARALSVLYPVAYAIKFAHKARGADFVVPPLEALWWADDPSVFVSNTRPAAPARHRDPGRCRHRAQIRASQTRQEERRHRRAPRTPP